MKVAIGYRPQSGPWGGGNRFVGNLTAVLGTAGHRIAFDLAEDDVDVVLLMDPRSRVPNFSFGAGAILRYLAVRNPQAIVVHRVNECDERKNTRTMNFRLRLANYCADHTVFVGAWLRDLPTWTRHPPRASSVIHNGADTAEFHAKGFMPWNGRDPLRLVTHHWGGNRMKGFDIYEMLDRMLAAPAWCRRIAFTYIGNVPRGFRFARARHLPPMTGPELAEELRSHHGYVTASINEPGGNHQNEGALCGLPLLYRSSGCLPEYCVGFGVPFDGPGDFEDALESYIRHYDILAPRMADYPHTAANCTCAWLTLFETLLARRREIVAERRLWRNPLMFAANQVPF